MHPLAFNLSSLSQMKAHKCKCSRCFETFCANKLNKGRTFCVASNKKCIWWIHYNTIRVCPVIDFLQRSIVFMNVCLPNFDYLL